MMDGVPNLRSFSFLSFWGEDMILNEIVLLLLAFPYSFPLLLSLSLSLCLSFPLS